MMSIKEIQAVCKKEKLKITQQYKCEFTLTNSPPKDEYVPGLYGGYDRVVKLHFMAERSDFCCAIDAIGNFVRNPALDKWWHLLLQWYVQTSNRKYFMVGLPERDNYKPINEALKKSGFTKVAQEKSRVGRYKVNVWEYLKK